MKSLRFFAGGFRHAAAALAVPAALVACSSDEPAPAPSSSGGLGGTGGASAGRGGASAGAAGHAGAGAGGQAGSGGAGTGEGGTSVGGTSAGGTGVGGTGGGNASLGGNAGNPGSAGSGGNAGSGGTNGSVRSTGVTFEPGMDTILVTQIIGPAGGTLVAPAGSAIAGVSVTFPPNALETDTEISLGFNDGVFRNAVGDWSRPNLVLKSAGATFFAEPVSFHVPAPDADALLTPYYLDGDNLLEPIALVDLAGGVATFKTFHASTYPTPQVQSATCDDLMKGSADSGFTPSKDGFAFENSVQDLAGLPDVGTGLCRGMDFYAIWRFQHPKLAPALSCAPTDTACIECQKSLALKAHQRVSSWYLHPERDFDGVKGLRALSPRQAFCGIAEALTNSHQPVALSLHDNKRSHSLVATGYSVATTTEELDKCGAGNVAVHVYNPNHKRDDHQIVCYDTKKALWQDKNQQTYEGYPNIWRTSAGSLWLGFSDLQACPPAGASGDPHLTTFDGLHYDFQRVGEFVLAQADYGLNVQVRLASYANSRRIATTVAVAAQIGDNRVEVNALGKSGAELWVNGVLSSPMTLSGGGDASLSGFTWPDGARLEIRDWGGRLDVQLHGFGQENPRGLLGNVNGYVEDELELRDGTVLKRPLDDAAWASFTSAWRISNAESLFHYEAGQDSSTFTDLSFPDAPASTAALSAADYAKARDVCLAAGISDKSVAVLEDCILDVGMTGDASFATGAALTPEPVSTEAVICPGAVVGEAVTVTNGGFETPHLAGNTWQTLNDGSSTLDGWAVGGTLDVTFGTFWQHAQGTQSLDLNGTTAATIAQAIPTVPGQAYQVSFSLAGNPYCAPTIKVLELKAANQRASFQFDITGRSFPDMGWRKALFVFRASDSTTQLTFHSLVDGQCGPTLDDIQVARLDCPSL